MHPSKNVEKPMTKPTVLLRDSNSMNKCMMRAQVYQQKVEPS